MTWRSVLIVLLVIGAAFSAWSLLTQRDDVAATIAADAQPDYTLQDFEMVALNAQGEQSFTLRAPELIRDPSSKTMDITTPVFLIPPGKDSRSDGWEVRSHTGWISAKGEELRLRGEVRAVSDGAAGVPVIIATEQLNVFPETDIINSAAEVSFTRPGSILRGRGLEMNLDTKLYSLQSEVRWHYAPTR
ncbi:MAG: LPS export ABC transporter periplasmic protein LptC [Lysobacter sp.]|nr:LPS export ABC transporter periplasmic protein LptC [Lysobacter sp.]